MAYAYAMYIPSSFLLDSIPMDNTVLLVRAFQIGQLRPGDARYSCLKHVQWIQSTSSDCHPSGGLYLGQILWELDTYSVRYVGSGYCLWLVDVYWVSRTGYRIVWGVHCGGKSLAAASKFSQYRRRIVAFIAVSGSSAANAFSIVWTSACIRAICKHNMVI